MENLGLNQEIVWGPGLLTSTLCCRWVGSEVRLFEYSFRCTAGVQCKGGIWEAEHQVRHLQGMISVGRERLESWGSGSTGRGKGEGIRGRAYYKWLCCWAGSW